MLTPRVQKRREKVDPDQKATCYRIRGGHKKPVKNHREREDWVRYKGVLGLGAVVSWKGGKCQFVAARSEREPGKKQWVNLGPFRLWVANRKENPWAGQSSCSPFGFLCKVGNRVRGKKTWTTLPTTRLMLVETR